MSGATRRGALGIGAALVAGAAAAPPPPSAIMRPEPGDMALGDPQAKVVVIEYASVGCPHCAVWANEVFPALKAQFVDTGKARFVMREMTTGASSLAAAGFLLARCAAPSKYFTVVDEVFRRQAEMFQPGVTPVGVLLEIAKGVGLDEAGFNACLNDQKALAALNERVRRHVEVDKVDSTPTFVVNGKLLVGEQTLDQLAAAIAAAKGRR